MTEKKLHIYKASAGTGKTYTLVRSYLSLVIRWPSSYQRILAITFTNAATLEMKQRIVEELVRLSNGTSDMRDSLEELTGLHGQSLKNNARKALVNILYDYSRFSVQTIDSFFTRIVRSLAQEFQLPMHYSIELDQEPLIREAIGQLYLEEDPDAGRIIPWMEEFSFQKISDSKSWDIDQDLQELGKKIFDEKFYRFL